MLFEIVNFNFGLTSQIFYIAFKFLSGALLEKVFAQVVFDFVKTHFAGGLFLFDTNNVISEISRHNIRRLTHLGQI